MNEFLEQFLIESRELVEQATGDLLALSEAADDTANDSRRRVRGCEANGDRLSEYALERDGPLGKQIEVKVE